MKVAGRSDRKSYTLAQAVRKFGDDRDAEAWFVAQRWPAGIACPNCGSAKISERKDRKPMPYRCRACRKYFSVRTGTIMQASKLGLGKWAIAIFLMSANLKGAPSMNLRRDLGVTQKSAWHLANRIREAWDDMADASGGAV